MLRFLSITSLVLLVLGAIAVPGWADIVYWDGADTLFGGLDHRFSNPLNWSTDVFPAATDSAYIEDGDTALIDETPPNEVMDLGLAITQDTSGYVNMTVGTVTITGDLRVGGGANTIAGFDMNGGTVNVGDEFLIGRANTATGTLNLVDGTINYNYRSMLAYDANSVAIVHQSGGSLLNNPEATNRSWSRWAYSTNSYVYYDLNGGTFQAEGLLMSTASDANGENNSVAIINQTGGTLTIDGSTVGSATGPSIRLSNGSGAISAYNLTNSACVVQNYAMSIAGSGNFTPTAQVNVNSGGQLTLQDVTNGYLRIAYTHATGGPSLGVLNLNTGGTVTAAWIQSGDGTTATTAGNAHFNFHGGTLVANSNQADFLRQMDAYVYSEGAKIDTDGHDVTINRALLAPTASGVQSIALSDGGSGYQGAPAVKITGGTGSGASAIAVVSGGVVTGITMTNPGTGYDPGDMLVVTLHGGGTATPATLGAVTLAANSASGGLKKLGLGTLTLAGANSYTGLTDVQAGTLRVTGSVAGSVDVADGAMWSANGTVGGNLDLSAGGDMTWSLAALADDLTGTPGTDFDQTVVVGNVVLGSISDLTLDFNLLAEEDRPGYATPNAFWSSDHSWIMIDAAGISGNFANWLNATFASGSFTTAIDTIEGDLVLNFVAGTVTLIPGDTNGDLYVNNDDALKLAQNWGLEIAGGFSVGDFNDDGWVNAADAAILAANWGDHTGSESSSPVPEPSTMALVLVGLMAMTLARRKSRCA